MIIEKIVEAKAASIRQQPVNANRASQLGHPCIRFLVFERTRWQEKVLHGPGLQAIYDLGNDIEERVIKDLKAAGIDIIEQQRAYAWPKFQITGHSDFKVILEGKAYPCEVKSMSPYIFSSINTVEDMKRHRRYYVRAYPGQLVLYLLLDEKEQGFFLLKNKVTGAMKEIPVDLDYELAESLLKKAEQINRHVAEGSVPDPIEWDDDCCSECGYIHICLPDRSGKEIQVLDRPELEIMLARLEEIKPLVDEYNELDRDVKEAIKGQDNLLLGNWLVKGKWIEKKEFTVKPSKYWQSKITKIS